jgi:hypothetical protein
MNKLPEQVIVDILKSQMLLSDDQIWIRYQNQVIPPDNRIYINVGMSDSQIISSVRSQDVDYDGMAEIIQVQSRDNIQIDIMSRSVTAIQRRWEMISALNTVYSEQQQENYNFRIFTIPTSFINASSAEGGSNINRFSIIIACHTWYKQEKVVQSPDDYYNDFETRADDAQTIEDAKGLIEFEIKEE